MSNVIQFQQPAAHDIYADKIESLKSQLRQELAAIVGQATKPCGTADIDWMIQKLSDANETLCELDGVMCLVELLDA
ncbi:MAG: hypothetical protein EBR82_36905 [Caulobacteraceae bacterium]|nr:hypothetical protein [Caulobacteraceae bacterium]